MKHLRQSRYFKLAVTLFLTGAALIVFYHIVMDFTGFREILYTAESIISPFVYGFVMAYLLCPVYNLAVRKTYGLIRLKNRRRAFAISKIIGTVISLLVLFGVVGGLIALLIPELIRSITGIIQTLPDRFDALTEWVQDVASGFSSPAAADALDSIVQRMEDSVLGWVQSDLMNTIGTYMEAISTGVIITLKAALNVLVGIIACVYLLNSKERFKAQAKKIILATTSKKVSDEIFDFGNFANRTFGGFINGKIIDSAIIGVICYCSMRLLGLPYPALVSTIVGVTNVIPFFGPFIGAIPSAIIIFLVSPLQSLYFLVLILVIQQLDGNVIGPTILGETTGLASFWVMFAIIVAGGMFGFIGMVLGVPVFAIIYYYFGRYIRRKLERKEMPQATDEYIEFNKYDINRKDVL
jgi:predicted PurR-regulated permease PerM